MLGDCGDDDDDDDDDGDDDDDDDDDDGDDDGDDGGSQGWRVESTRYNQLLKSQLRINLGMCCHINNLNKKKPAK